MKIVAFGNPLLDTIILLNDDSLLKKYNLEKDGQKEVTQDEMKALTKDIRHYEKTVAAGGCAQNTLKVMQWLSRKQFKATIFGSIGYDDVGKTLKDILKSNGVETNYVTQCNYMTGTTVALVTEESRSLVAYLGAAEVLSLDNFKSNPHILPQIEEASLIYMEGFFITKRLEVATYILNHCHKPGKHFAFNLSGEYLCKEYTNSVIEFIKKSDIIFGNKKEFEAICAAMNEFSVDDMITDLSRKGKTVVVTSGPDSVICVGEEGNSLQHVDIKVPLLKKDEIVDTTGAGDAFVAGFLTGFLYKKPLRVCCELGCDAAQEIIRRRGCTVPEGFPNFNLN